MYVCMYVCRYVRTYVCMYVYIYTYKHMLIVTSYTEALLAQKTAGGQLLLHSRRKLVKSADVSKDAAEVQKRRSYKCRMKQTCKKETRIKLPWN